MAAKQHIRTGRKAPAAPENQRTPEIRQLYKPEPPRKTMLRWEKGLVNLARKLDWDGRMQVYVAAERLALSRIRNSIARRRHDA